MLQIFALLILTGVAIDIARRIYSNRAIFLELGQPTAIAWLIWLYPLPFLLPLFAKSFFVLFLFRIPMGALFFVPALIAARGNQRCLELAGSDRVKPALAAVYIAQCAGIMGMMGVLMLCFLLWIFRR